MDHLRPLIQRDPAIPRYSFANAWEMGFRVFRSEWKLLVVASFIAALLAGVSRAVDRLDVFPDTIAWLLAEIAFANFIVVPIGVGTLVLGSRAARGEPGLRVRDVMFAYSRLWRTLGLYWIAVVVFLLAVLGPVLVLEILGQFGVNVIGAKGPTTSFLLMAWRLLFGVVLFVGALAVAMPFLMAIPIGLDPTLGDHGIVASVKHGFALTKGKRLSLSLAFISAFIVCVLTFFLLVIGIILIGYPLLTAVCGASVAMVTEPLRVQRASR